MRKSSKVISLALSGLMATSCVTTAMVSVSAAASYQSLKDRIAAGHQIVYFRFPTSAWGPKATVKMNAKKHTVNVNCNYYAIWGNQNEVISRAWEAPSTSMYADVAATDDLYFFDITASGQGEMEDGAEYGILFSTKVNAAKLRRLEHNIIFIKYVTKARNVLCIGIIAAGFSAGSRELVEAHTSAEVSYVLLFKCRRVIRVERTCDIRGEHAGSRQASPKAELAVGPGQIHDFGDRIFKEHGPHSGRAD